jgi:hypothetical protein
MRNILAGLLGLIFGVFFLGLTEMAGSSLFPADIPLPVKRADWDTWLEHVPFMAKFFVILGYAVGGFVAGAVATFVQGRKQYRPALGAACVMQLFAWFNMMSFPHPLWMWVSGTLIIVPMAMIAYHVTRKKDDGSAKRPPGKTE